MLTLAQWGVVALTVQVAGLAVCLALPVSLLAALRLARAGAGGRLFLVALVHLPLALPPVVTGWLLLLLLGVHGPVGRVLDAVGIRLVFTSTGASIACAVMILPLMTRSIRLSLEAIDPGLYDAARVLGASRLDRLLSITLPLAAPGLLAALALGFTASLGEFGAVITFAANIPGQTRTLPLAIYTALQSPGGEGEAARLAGMSIGLAVAGLLLAETLGRKSRNGLF